MMKILKYFIVPVKIFLVLVVVAFLVYYRSAIFQPHINRYVDSAQFFVEDKLDINIPAYVSTINSELNDNSHTAIDTDHLMVGNVLSEKQTKSIAPEEVVEESPAVVEKEILIILNNDVSKSVGKPVFLNDAADTVSKEIDSTVDKEEKVIAGDQYVINDNSGSLDPKVMQRLAETVNIINRKVDMLFDVSDFNNKHNTVTIKNKDIAIVKNKIEIPDNTITAVSDEVSQKPKNNNLNGNAGYENAAVINKYSANAREILLQARKTFWNGRPLDSEKLYLDLLNIQGSNPDIYGELGNVYYSQGKWQEAGKAYYEAAIRLLDLNQTHQVNYLLRVIQGLDAESAEKLKLKISG